MEYSFTYSVYILKIILLPMKTLQSLRGFTLVELIVTATILVILTAVGFYSYSQNLVDARDSLRKSDVADIESRLKLYKQKRWAYPSPGDSFDILNNGLVVAKQWKMNNKVSLTTASSIPKDPSTKGPYTYSITPNKQEFELSVSLENGNSPIAILKWDYKSVSKNVLPTISLAIDSINPIEIHDGVGLGGANRMAFIFNLGWYNLPYTFEEPYSPQTDGTTTFAELLADPTIEYWQNSDYRTCGEIYAAGKAISGASSEEYQVLSSTGFLTNTGCTFP